jgi:exodeoxyribonuclease VII small subunit
MADESYNFSTARTRLEAIVTQVRKKDTSLEKSLDLLEEGVRLANACTELIDHADWVAAGAPAEAGCAADEAGVEHPGDALAREDGSESRDEVLADADQIVASEDTESDLAGRDKDHDAVDPADDAWADDAEPENGLGVESDPSADER